jgi:(p)ppGpp synthase/HD superfamily hydrolase
VTTHDGKVDQVSATTNKRKEGVIKIKVGIAHKNTLDNIILNLQKVGGVLNIERLMK